MFLATILFVTSRTLGVVPTPWPKMRPKLKIRRRQRFSQIQTLYLSDLIILFERWLFLSVDFGGLPFTGAQQFPLSSSVGQLSFQLVALNAKSISLKICTFESKDISFQSVASYNLKFLHVCALPLQ